MTIYVDSAMIPATVPNGRVSHTSRWCHLMSDEIDPDELHRFAALLGLRRSYFQINIRDRAHDHYDVTLGKRAQAIALGAQVIDGRGLVELLHRRRMKIAERAGRVIR